MAAVRAGDAGAVRSLLDEHAALRARLNETMPGLAFGATILTSAVEREDRAMIDLLIAAGADPDQRSHWWAGGFTVLDFVAPELVPFLLERGATMTIHAAARLGLTADVARLLAEHPAAARLRGGDGQTPLHRASTIAIAAALLDAGADIDALDVDHESTPAQYLIGDHPDVARFLLTRGCRTDILLASALGEVELVRAYLDADPSSVETTVSPEYFPMRNREAGGSIYIWTLGGGKSAHMVAHERGHAETVQLLLERSPESLALATACRIGDDVLVTRLLEANPGLVAALKPKHARAIVAAAEAGDTTAVRRMLSIGWPANVSEASGVTALHWAAFSGNAAVIELLLDHGASRDIKESRFQATPLGWAQHAAQDQPAAGGDYRAAIALLGGETV